MSAGDTYTPQGAPPLEGKALVELSQWVERELGRVGTYFTNFDLVQYNILHVAPQKPREGAVAIADGADWNPGSGGGIYIYFNGLWRKPADFIFATDYGVKADSSTDDTVNLQAAISDTPEGFTLMLPRGWCKVLGSGSTALSITRPIDVVGQGWGTGLVLDGSFPNTRDVLSIIPSAASRGYGLRNFRIVTGDLGRHAIAVDGGSNSLVYNMHFERLAIDPTDAGNSIHGVGATSGVFAYSSIRDSLLESIFISTAGDGFTIQDNIISNAGNAAINVAQVVGAGNLNIRNNVTAGDAGAIIIGRSASVVLDGNEVEQQSALTEANGALVDLTGDTGLIVTAHVLNCILNVSGTGSGVSSLIRVDNVDSATIDGNWLGGKGSAHIVATSDSVDLIIGGNNTYYTNNLKVALDLTDSGTRTAVGTAEHFLSLAANQTGADSATAQTWFPGGGATQITVIAGTTYFFEGYISLARTAGTTSHITTLEWAGTATVASIAYALIGTQSTDGFFSPQAAQMKPGSSTTGDTCWSTNNTANENLAAYVSGIVRFSAAGTFKPQFKYSAAPGGAPTIQKNTWFRMRLIGQDDVLSRGWT